jgi:hypothetical protein
VTRECSYCAKAFTPKDDGQRYCGRSCKAAAKEGRRGLWSILGDEVRQYPAPRLAGA